MLAKEHFKCKKLKNIFCIEAVCFVATVIVFAEPIYEIEHFG
jgi:hypothetical protein